MSWSSSLAWLAALAARREARPGQTDPADMGTAFGLDASMVPAEYLAREPLVSAGTEARQPWGRRIVRRSDL